MDIGILSNIMQVHQECPSLTEHLLDCGCTQEVPCLSFTGLFSLFDSSSSSRFLLHDAELAELFISYILQTEISNYSCALFSFLLQILMCQTPFLFVFFTFKKSIRFTPFSEGYSIAFNVYFAKSINKCKSWWGVFVK